MSNVSLPWPWIFLLLCLGGRLEAGTVQTLEGRTHRGTIRLLSPDTLLVSASEPVRISLTNLLRVDFSEPTNARPVLPTGNSRLVRADVDENRGALPEPWQNSDVGKVTRPGASAHSRGHFSLESNPQVKKAKGDALHFIYQPWQGDGEIVARVASVNPRDARDKQARAGVMMRKGLEADSPNVSMSISGGLGSVFKRVSRKGTRVIDDNRADLMPPYWVKLTRESGNIAGFHSTDGKNWKLVGSSATDLPERVLVGLALTSNRRGPAAGDFDHVSVRSIVPQSAFIPKIVLRDGTTIADRFLSMDESTVVFSKDRRGLRVAAADVSRILFQPLFEANSLTPGRAGVLLKNGDFVDGEFRGIENGKVKVSSVLLGQRTYDLHPKVVAVLLRDPLVRNAALEVVTRDGSVLRPRTLVFEKEAVRVDEPLAGSWQIAFDELVEIRRSARP